VDFRLPSSHTFETPARWVAPSMSAAHVPPDLSAAMATALILGNSLVTAATRGAARPAGWVTISGTVSRCAPARTVAPGLGASPSSSPQPTLDSSFLRSV
jgi:hypothetical protein